MCLGAGDDLPRHPRRPRPDDGLVAPGHNFLGLRVAPDPARALGAASAGRHSAVADDAGCTAAAIQRDPIPSPRMTGCARLK
jgi:hypothetical protein